MDQNKRKRHVLKIEDLNIEHAKEKLLTQVKQLFDECNIKYNEIYMIEERSNQFSVVISKPKYQSVMQYFIEFYQQKYYTKYKYFMECIIHL